MTKQLFLGALSIWAATGCAANSSQGNNPANDRYALASNGSYDLYSGPNIAQLVQQGKITGTNDPYSYFKLGDVPQGFVDRAAASSQSVYSFSFEDPSFSEVSVVVNQMVNMAPVKTATTPGSPCTTGIGQVWVDTDGTVVGLFDLDIWVRYPNGPTVKNVYTTGLRADPNLPTLHYDSDPSQLPSTCQ